MSFQVSGMEELLAQLRHMGEKGDKIKEQAEMEGAKIMQQAIKEGTPIGPHTKHARDHVEIEKIDDGMIVGYGESIFTCFSGSRDIWSDIQNKEIQR
ncbi:HK97 gp10 family phage protein [Paenibacillus larvae]|nr:HK97 gp10 family phage protein [Paenibacillus larvae]MDT2261372.1 HK97 gp10 family phage protein [Paenibacillus larvae]